MAERAKQRAEMRKLQASLMLSGSGSVQCLGFREMQLPPRKRTLFPLGKKLELEEEEEATAEGPANATSAPEQEESGETKGGDCNKNKSVHCVLNQGSSIPFPNIESLSIQENAEEPPPVKQGEEEERKPGQPKNKESKLPRGECSGSS